MRDPVRLRLVVIVAAVLLAGCASPDEAADAPTPLASPTATTATEPTATEPPSDASEPPTGDLFFFTAGTVDGGEIDASIYASGQVALWFWAPW